MASIARACAVSSSNACAWCHSRTMLAAEPPPTISKGRCLGEAVSNSASREGILGQFSRLPPSLTMCTGVASGGIDASRSAQSMILLIGYSTIPRAPAAFSAGMIVRTVLSSRIVLTATQSGSDNDEMVGCWSAGS